MITQSPAADTAEDVEIFPDTAEPWLPAIATLETGLPAAAVAAGVGALGYWLNAGRGPFVAALIGAFAAVLILLAVIDVKTLRLPDAIVLPMYPVLGAAVAAGAMTGAITGTQAVTAFISMAAAFIILWIVAFFTGGLGFGDVKLGGVLALVCGLHSGYAAALGALILPMVLGGLAVLPLLFTGQRNKEFAFGPYLVAGALLALLIPDVIVPLSRGSLPH